MDTSFETADESPNVYRIRFMPSELTNIYNEILPNVSVNDCYNYFCKYITSSVEPIGWHAIWRTTAANAQQNTDPNNEFSTQYDFEVEVMDVLHNRLEAIAVVLKLIHPKESELTAEQFDEKEKLLKETKIVNIPLIQLFVISDGDNDNQFYRTALIIEQIRFFYNNLWRPWDELSNTDTQEVFVESKLKPRLELSFDIKDKIIPQSTVNRIKNLLSEAWNIKHKIDSIDKPFGAEDMSIEDNSDIDYINETDLVEAMRLKLRLEDIEREMKLLEDKHLRIIAATLKKSNSEANGLEDDLSNKQNRIHLIAKSFTLKASKEILISLSNLITEEETPVVYHNSLSRALQCVRSGDKVYVMPGRYSCSILPWIDTDIEINGFGGETKQIVLEPNDSVGDIFINCNSSKIVFNGLTLKATSEMQCLLMIHSGFVSFNNCVLDGAHQTRNAVIVLSKAKVEIENCEIVNEKEMAIISRKGSVVINRDDPNLKPVDNSDEMHISINAL